MWLISPQKWKQQQPKTMKIASECKIYLLGPYQDKSNPSFQWSKYSLLIWGIDSKNLPVFPRFTPGFRFLFKIFDFIAKSGSIRLAQIRSLGSCDCYWWLCGWYCLRSTKHIEDWLCRDWRLSFRRRKIKPFPHSWPPDNWGKEMMGQKLSTIRLWWKKTCDPTNSAEYGIILTNTI